MTTGQEIDRASIQPPKLGLALSGGGFRASLFHVGVLARLAMQGLLKQIEVISTVSGGSIIGAYYYLHVRNLLERKPDHEITDQDYQALVERIELEFFKAVTSNFRLSTFARLSVNLRTARFDYSHSDRIAELYDERLYRPVFYEGNPGPLENLPPVEMRHLKIYPPGANGKFDPEIENAPRAAKVPILVINATTLNTGHNWRFTAKQMGEPRLSDLRVEIDKKPIRLRRPDNYDCIVERQRNLPLGHAVAASAAVPGIFHPLAISDLYPADIRVQLVDGGVHDNQGVQGLLDANCTHFIVSDGSLQTGFESEPETQIARVLNRASAIFQDRVRDEQLVRLFQTRPNPRVAFMHLRKGLPAIERAWADPLTGRSAASDIPRPAIPPCANFGVDGNVQERLSRVRTDLDCFTEVEAHSLMLDGYLIAGAVLPYVPEIVRLAPGNPKVDAARWRFLELAEWLAKPSPEYLDQLDVAKRTFLKVLYLIQPKRVAIAVRVVLGLVILTLLLGLTALLWKVPVSLGMLVLIGLLFAAFYYSGRLAHNVQIIQRFRTPIDYVKRIVGRAALWAILTPIVYLYLKFIDPVFLRLGAIERLCNQPPGGRNVTKAAGTENRP